MHPLPASRACRLRFAVFELDVRAGELRKSGRLVRLSGQPLQVLELLIKRPREVVTRDELRHELWPAETHVDFEHNLNSAVKRLRAALGDSADTPRFIETLPRRGYRFLGPVEVIVSLHDEDAAGSLRARDGSTHPALAGSVPAVPHGGVLSLSKDQPRLAARWAVALAVVTVIALTGWRLITFRRSPVEPVQIRSLAVLPFANISNDPEQGYFADGMTDALITSLAQIKSLRIISRTSVMSYRDAERPISTIARELSVDGIIEGSVMRAGDQVRITAQLIHAQSDRHLWAASYDGRLSDVLALQNKVARAIAVEVKASLSPPEEARLVRATHVDPSVAELYLRGRHLLSKRTEPELRRALEYFQQAVEKDSRFALAHAGIAQVWDALASWPGYVAPKDGYPRAKAAALHALSLDDALAEAQTALASVTELHDWDLPAAERRYQQAIAVNPNYALAHHRYGQFLARTGRPAAALEAGLRAHALDPLSLETNVGLSIRLFGVGRAKEALERMRAAVELDRNYFDSHIHLADLYQRQGSLAEAIAAAERGIELSQRSAHALHGLAVIYVREKEIAKARPLIAELEVYPRQKNPYDIGMLFLQMGEIDKALLWLRRACEERTPAMAFLGRAQAGRPFDAVRSDRRFLRILECAGREKGEAAKGDG